MTGLEILAGVLVLSTAAGLVHRTRNGRMRTTPRRRAPDGTSRLTSRLTSRPTSRPTRRRVASRSTTPYAATSGLDLTPDDSLRSVLARLGAEPGRQATLLQFSSAFCAPCRATRRILTEVTELVPGVTHVEVDAEQHLDLVRRLGVLKTPTTLVLDDQAREVRRASGQPRKADVLAALGSALP